MKRKAGHAVPSFELRIQRQRSPLQPASVHAESRTIDKVDMEVVPTLLAVVPSSWAALSAVGGTKLQRYWVLDPLEPAEGTRDRQWRSRRWGYDGIKGGKAAWELERTW